MVSRNTIYPVPNIKGVLQSQIIQVDNDKFVRCSPSIANKELVAYADEHVKTLHDVFMHGLKASGGGPCLGWRPARGLPYIWISYQNVLDRCQRLGSGLIPKYAQPNPSQFIGLYSQNRVEWTIVEQMCNSYSMVLVPINFFSIENIILIIKKCNLKIIVVDTQERTTLLLKECINKTISLDLLIHMNKLNASIKELIKKSGVIVKWFSEIEGRGSKCILPFVKNKEKLGLFDNTMLNKAVHFVVDDKMSVQQANKTYSIDQMTLKRYILPKPENLNTIVFKNLHSSDPVGVKLTHANIIAGHAGSVLLSKTSVSMFLTKNDVLISYMPLSYMFERAMTIAMFYCGGSVGFFQGDLKLLFDDISTLEPTILSIDPRIVYRLYDMVWSVANHSVIKHFLLERTVKIKRAQLEKGYLSTNTFLDKFLFKNIRKLLGGNLKVCMTTTAPIGVDVFTFVRIAIGVPIIQGYGLTESCAAAAISFYREYTQGSGGSPILCNYIKLIDVPEFKLFAKQDIGEICLKGKNICQGYFDDIETTKDRIDEKGWLHTGDIGKWLSNGCLEIIDSKNDLFKLSSGIVIAPLTIESVLLQSMIVSQIFVYGNETSSGIVAVVHPHLSDLPMWCKKRGIVKKEKDLLESKNVKQLILKELCKVGTASDLKSYQLPKMVHLAGQQFTIENNLLTSSLRNRRQCIYNLYEAKLKEMCKKIDPANGG